MERAKLSDRTAAGRPFQLGQH